MSKRLLMTPEGLKVSKPSIHVDVASDEDLFFDSSGSQLRILQRGAAFMSASDPRRSDAMMVQRDIMYGRTFPSPPMGFFGYGGGTIGHNIPSPPGMNNGCSIKFGKRWSFYSGSYTGSTFPDGSATAHWFAILSMVDRARVRWFFSTDYNNWGSFASAPRDATFYYTLVAYT